MATVTFHICDQSTRNINEESQFRNRLESDNRENYLCVRVESKYRMNAGGSILLMIIGEILLCHHREGIRLCY